jgi:Tol biopolymer transport system component
MTSTLRAVIAIVFVAVAACTEPAERDLPDVAVGSPSGTAPSASPGGQAPRQAGRLAVLDEIGNLVTVAPDGSDPVIVAEAVDGQTALVQPTWSPDGTRLAFIRLDAAGGAPSSTLVTTLADGTRPTEAATAVAPFYLSWDPTSSRVAYLGSPGPSEIELGVVDVEDGGDRAVSLDGGDPFYLSWGPRGDQMLVHVGFDRLDRLQLDGTLDTVDARPGAFRAPVWTSDGRSFVYAAGSVTAQRLVVRDVGAQRSRDLVEFSGSITFVVNHDATHVAFQVVEGQNDVGPLSVLDRETGAIEVVSNGFVPAFFWSPQGDRLLYLLPEADQDRIWFRWGVWGGEETFTGERFYPSQTFGRDYLPFFEQYAQSMSLWAPDGRAFAYAGTNELGQAGIWVQSVRPTGDPVFVMNGSFAAWSPD